MARDVAPIGVIDSFKYAFSSATRLRTEVLAGLVVGLALIPEAISFSIVAGLDPASGLWASVIMAMVIAFTGGRPAMITAATGAIALVIAPLSAEHGPEYLIAAVLLGGLIQVILALLGVAKLMRFIPQAVMTGFVNALGILLFTTQLEHLIDVPWLVYVLTAVGLLVMIFWPKINRVIPAPLIVIILLTGIVMALPGSPVPNVSDQGELPTSLPAIMFPDVPFTLETLQIILPFALGVAIVGLMESLMTAQLVDDITDTQSDKTRESWGQGVANIAASFVGGMGGCAMIGQTMINVRESGARTRLSTFLAGFFLLILLLAFGTIVGEIPMAALVAIMIMVAVGTVEWDSLRPARLRVMPISETMTMLITVIGTLATGNLAVGVILGVLTAMIGFATNVAQFAQLEKVEPGHYRVTGQLFFASSNQMPSRFNYDTPEDHVVVDFSGAHVWDASTVNDMDKVRKKFAERGKTIEYVGLNEKSQKILDRLSELQS